MGAAGLSVPQPQMQTRSGCPTSPEQIIFQLILFRAKLGNNPPPQPGTPSLTRSGPPSWLRFGGWVLGGNFAGALSPSPSVIPI